jgi:hypothetical protein
VSTVRLAVAVEIRAPPSHARRSAVPWLAAH